MRTKLLASTLLAASLIAAPAIAFAHSKTTTPETKSEATTPKQSMRIAMRPQHHFTNHMTKNHMSKGTTTGMGSGHKSNHSAAQKSDKSSY